MPAIAELRTRTVEIPLTTVFSTSNKTTTAARLLLVNVRTDDGVEGWGEAQLNPTFTTETPASARAGVEAATELVVGRDAEAVIAAVPEIARRLDRRHAARCALSMALWDLRGRLLDVPIYQLLGGARRRQVPVAYHIGNFDDDRDAADARTAADAGFGIVKLKVGRPDVADDLRAVERVRRAAGADVRLFVDVNQAWGLAQAAAFIDRAKDIGVEVVEQPLPQWDVAGLARLSATPGVVVAADESMYAASDLLSALTAGTRPGGVVIKLLKAGGIDGAQSLLALSQLSGVAPFLAGMCGDSSIGSAALLHVAAAAVDLPLGTAITPHFSRADLVDKPLEVVDGHVHLDAVDGPGLGVTVDPAAVERTARP